MSTERLKAIWEQCAIPVVLRRDGPGDLLRVRLPFGADNRWWLRNGRIRNPAWVGGKECYWELPKSWFNDFVDRALVRYGKVYVIQPYREKEVCAPACWNAVGHECQCSCMGANHGSGNCNGFFEVSDNFAVRWGKRELACRLIVSTMNLNHASIVFTTASWRKEHEP